MERNNTLKMSNKAKVISIKNQAIFFYDIINTSNFLANNITIDEKS